MIRVGKRGISGMFIGEIPVRAAYLGNSLIYEERTSRNVEVKNEIKKNNLLK